MFIGREICLLRDQLRTKTGNPLVFFWFISILIILCPLNVSNKTYHDTRENQFFAKHIGGMGNITLFHITAQLHPKHGIPWQFFSLLFYYYYVFLVFQKNLSWQKGRSIICTTRKKDSLMLLERTLCQLMEHLQPKTGDPLVFCLSLF